jgi:hypothetical protein
VSYVAKIQNTAYRVENSYHRDGGDVLGEQNLSRDAHYHYRKRKVKGRIWRFLMKYDVVILGFLMAIFAAWILLTVNGIEIRNAHNLGIKEMKNGTKSVRTPHNIDIEGPP